MQNKPNFPHFQLKNKDSEKKQTQFKPNSNPIYGEQSRTIYPELACTEHRRSAEGANPIESGAFSADLSGGDKNFKIVKNFASDGSAARAILLDIQKSSAGIFSAVLYVVCASEQGLLYRRLCYRALPLAGTQLAKEKMSALSILPYGVSHRRLSGYLQGREYMSKRELIDCICEINRSAKPEFLATFSEEELGVYLEHLMELDLEELAVCC
jgi:hypothetical protein